MLEFEYAAYLREDPTSKSVFAAPQITHAECTKGTKDAKFNIKSNAWPLLIPCEIPRRNGAACSL